MPSSYCLRVYLVYPISLHITFFFFFFNDTATTEIYTLSLHDALPISRMRSTNTPTDTMTNASRVPIDTRLPASRTVRRSEEHTSELQSQSNLVCRLLLEKKKKQKKKNTHLIDKYIL